MKGNRPLYSDNSSLSSAADKLSKTAMIFLIISLVLGIIITIGNLRYSDILGNTLRLTSVICVVFALITVYSNRVISCVLCFIAAVVGIFYGGALPIVPFILQLIAINKAKLS